MKQPYDIFIDDSGKEHSHHSKINIGGSLNKEFCRYDSKLFSHLIEELRSNPNSTYITHMNDLIKSGYTPKWISVLEKEVRNNELYVKHFENSEVIGSRICNLFGVPTAYNFTYRDKCLSVDFMSPGYKFITVGDILHEYCDGRSGVKYWLENLKTRVMSEYPNTDFQKIAEDLIPSFILRYYILNDYDFNSFNFGMLMDENSSLVCAPNFDMEYICDNTKSISLDIQMSNDLNYLYGEYPNIIEKFINRAKSIICDDLYNDTIQKTIDVDIFKSNDNIYVRDMIVRNIKELLINYNCKLMAQLQNNK